MLIAHQGGLFIGNWKCFKLSKWIYVSLSYKNTYNTKMNKQMIFSHVSLNERDTFFGLPFIVPYCLRIMPTCQILVY